MVYLPYTEDIEIIPADEAQAIQRVIDMLKVILARGSEKTGRVPSDMHAKTHGYARCEFNVLPNLPDELAQGLFASDNTYRGLVRFSNSAWQMQSDAIPDGRGMAVKVLGVPGETIQVEKKYGPVQDLMMINHPAFFASNVNDLLRLEHALVQTGRSSLAIFQSALTGGDWNPLHWHWREMLNAARIVGHYPAHPAGITYFSIVPIRYGNYVAKYRVKPVGDGVDSYLELITRIATEPNAMRLALEETLRTREVLFEFQVQLRTSHGTMPLEDACVEWPESESPYRTVAHLLLPRQDIESLRLEEDFKDLSFNVWNALTAHRPLGGINRLRREVYAVSSAWRHQQAEIT